jgi:hypothetical protein
MCGPSSRSVACDASVTGLVLIFAGLRGTLGVGEDLPREALSQAERLREQEVQMATPWRGAVPVLLLEMRLQVDGERPSDGRAGPSQEL